MLEKYLGALCCWGGCVGTVSTLTGSLTGGGLFTWFEGVGNDCAPPAPLLARAAHDTGFCAKKN